MKNSTLSKIAFLFGLSLTTIASAQSNRLSTLAHVIRNGQTEPRVIYNIWSTEYPSPVIDVNSRNKTGTTTVQAHQFVQDLSSPFSCQIKNGLYHPWSQSGRSAKGYITVSSHDLYRVEMKNNVLDLKLQIPQGSILTEVVYLSEGFCAGVVRSQNDGENQASITPIDGFDCQTLVDNPIFTKLSSDQGAELEQYIKVKCENGKTGFVRDEDMLKAPGVKQGEITGFGSVGPAPKN